MAERPLYTLYKNLKAQNYDVPDDYNKFESALTRDGKGGADNRHAIYENLKAQNFDVPNTYERFYSALFEPRSKTSSRAKGGSVPMSAVDRARFSAGAAAISASANNAVRQAKRNIQTKLGQAKKFNGGRVSPRLKNPLQNQNVQKNEFNYNSTTGKTGTYTTTDGVEFNNEYDAAQYQNQLDKQGEQYINAVNTGEIPSVFDVRDKNGNYDLQENINKNGTYLTEEGARNQFDKKLADAYARKKEIEAAIAEDHRLHGNPLLSYGASIGASNGRTAEQSDYSNKLATSLALVKQQIGALEAVKQYPTSSWGEDALKALDNTAFTAKTWDFGLTDFATMGQMERIKTKMDNNLPLSGSDKMLLKSKLGADAAAALEDEKMGNIYRWTKIAGQSLPFMADFFLTGGYGGITKVISRGALKFAAKRGMGKVSAAILKNTGIVAGDVIGSYAMAGTEQALKTGADIMQRHLGNLYQDEKGDYKFGTFDENGNLLHEGGESMGTALYKGLTSAMVENYTEKLFGHNYGIKKGAVNFMEKHGMNASAEFFKNIGKSGWYTNSKKWMEKFGINGFGEEVMEEEIGIPLHALLDGDNKFSDLLDTKQQLDIIGGMALSVGSMYAMGAGSRPVKGVYNRAQYYRFRNKVNVADSDAQNLIGDKWEDIKDKIDNTTNKQMGGVLADILRQRDTMSKDQINAAINYGINLMKMRGYNVAKTAEMNAREITNEPTTPEEQHQEDIDNAYSEGHDADDADKHDIQLEHEDQMKTLAGLLNISEQQLSAMNDDELQSLTGQNDKLDQAIYDYQLSSARYQGVTDDAQDKIDMAANQAAQRVDMYTDKSRGSVRNATVKASGGAEDYGVYIISGNIATNEDGSINVADSDDMILFYDPTTNSVEHADALRFAELGDEVPADDVKAQAVADAKENAIKEVAGIVDGTIDVGSQFKVTGADGLEHTYEILADYGDGTAAISIDGNVVENPYSLEDLQQLKDLEDQKRLEAAKAQREQMENERAAQQTEQTQETEQSEETQPSLDFDQILNDNGNVVLVDVLGKDGNTKYPSSQLFLIRDSGAKAKVMELKSDGTLVPHAVNKKDVRTATTMTLDEYKQAMAESSMIEENSGENRGEIEVETPAIEGETAAPAEEAAAPESAETPATEQTPGTPAMTLEDGTIVPMLEDGNPDFSKLTADQTAELYDSQFGEDADSVISGWVSDAKKALDKANNMTVKGKNFVEQKAAKEAKEKAIADAQATYDSAVAIRDAYNERQLAKVEDTAEGRKELIEKARRKFARLKSAVKDDAEAVSQLYKDVVGSLLHRLYDGTGIDVTDTIPLTAEEYVASNLGAHSLNYEGTEISKGVKQETGLSREDFAKTQLLAADGKGTTIDDLVHSLWENRPSNLESLDTQDIRNALIGVLTSGFKASEARNYIENLRIAQAENILEEQKKAADNAAFAEEQKANQEEEEKKSEENEKINEQTNENINTPELSHEQQKAMEDGEKLGFPAFDKEGEPINEYVIELANWAKGQGLEIDPTSKSNSYADLFLMCKDGFGVSTLVPDEGENINQVVYFPDNVQDFDQLWKLQEEFNAGRDLKHSSNIDSEITEGATFYDADTAREFKEFVDKKVEEQNKVFGEQRPEEDLPFSAKENGKQQTTAERAADVEKNKVDDMKVVDNIVGQKTRKTFERLAKMMGANIQWQYSDKLGNGWIQETTDSDGNVHRTIFITLDSSITEGAQFIFGHEMTHQIKRLNPASYNELTQLVLDTYGSDAFDKAIDETMKRYSDAGFSGRARDYYAEEVVADAVGEMIRDLNLAHTLAMKMSHPLLAAIHEILQKIKLAFFGTEYSDVTKNIIRSIEQAYVKTANGEVTNSETGEDVSFSLRQKPEPKKKGVGYKVFVLKDGKLYPPMVANPDGAATPVGVWLDADAAPIAGESKTGRPQVKQGGKGTQGGSGKLAYRPGWHLGVVPYAIQFNRKDADGNKTLFPKNFVFAEVEYAADVDYQEEARQEGINPSGKYQHSLAGLKHLPTDGYYMYRTNPNPETDPWVITGAMKVNRILTRAEQAELVKNAGREPQQIQDGDIVTDDVVNSINQEIAAAPKFSLKVYHGSGADFTEFDFDHMGEGAGSQAFGWGGYVTSSEKIARGYTSLAAQSNGLKREELKSNISRAKERLPFMREGEYKTELENEIKQWQKELANLDESKNLYEVEIPENNGSNYLDWDAPITDELIDKVVKALPSLRSYDIEYFKKDRTFDNFYKTISMRSVKDDASFNDDKAASKLLASLGYTGIKYKAGRNFGGAKEGDTNYVIFKPEDMKITEHTKFSLKDNQGNPLNQDGTLKLDKIKSVDELTDGDFLHPTRNVELPSLPKKIADAIGTEGKPVVIKKNIFERNYIRHKDVTPELSKVIFKSALYNPDLYGQNQKKTRPYNWVLINTKDEKGNNRTVLLEVNPNKDNVEIVHWHFVDERGLQKIKKQADREDGQLLILPSNKEEVGALSDPTVNLSAAKIDNSSETAKENGEKFSLKDEKIKSVAEKFGVNEDDVAMYANAVERGSTAEAARARANIKRYLLQANEDKISSFKDIIKYIKPINEALKENFGDLDAMIEERRKQVEAQRNAMEAARKRAQEEEEKRQKHLDELSLIPTDELDKRYMDAIDNNDESTAREMLDESARRNGYGDVDSDYQGQGAWTAPSNPQYESDEARRADIENSPDVNLEDIALGYNLQPDDYFDNPRAYMNNTAYGLESAHVIKNALDAIKNGEKDVKVKVYRAVPTSVKEGKLRNGDWVTPSKKYAEMHGDNRLDGKYRIIEDEVPANQLWWDGNDANEFGFDDGKEYRYKNAKNNRKLNDIITYDNKGNVIPPSKRFNSRKSDIRFSLKEEKEKIVAGAYADGKVPHAFADELLPTLRTKSGDVIVMPDGKVYRAMGRVLARVSGVSDDYKMPFSENLSHTIIGNGIPTQLTEHVIAPLLTGSDPKFSLKKINNVKDSRVIPTDVDKNVSSQIEKKFDDEIEKIKSETPSRDLSRLEDELDYYLFESSTVVPTREALKDRIKYFEDEAKQEITRQHRWNASRGNSGENNANGESSFALSRSRAAIATYRRELAYREARIEAIRNRLGMQSDGEMSLSTLVRYYKGSDRGRNAETDRLFDKALDIVKRLGVEFNVYEGADIRNPKREGVSSTDRRIELFLEGMARTELRDNDFTHTILHEMLHQATVGSINLVKKGKAEGFLTPKQIEGVNEILEIYDKVKDDKERFKENTYGLTDAYELTAQMADLRQRKAMGLTIWDKVVNAAHEFARKGDRSILQRLKDAWKKLFEVSDKDKMDKAINDIMDDFKEKIDDISMNNIEETDFGLNGNTRFSLRYDQFEHDLNQWKKDNNLPKDAQRPTIPQRNAGESAVDFLRRVDEYRKQMALWKTAPTYEQHLLSDDTALGEFNRELQRGSVLKRIAFQDSMLAIRKAQEAIMKEVGVDRLNMAEDAYTAENRSHGKGKNEFEEYNNEFLQPLRKAYHQMKKVLGDSYDNVRVYMMAKHGLERDAQMAFKKSLEADYEDVNQRSAAYKAYKNDLDRVSNDADLEFGRVDFTTWRQKDNALRGKYSPSYMDYRYDDNGIAYDYSGLSSLFDGSDFEEAAHRLVRDVETKHLAEVQALWNATNAATKKILRDGFKAGMMSKDAYEYVKGMYSHYIPLRGWDGTTADQVWDYIGGGKGAFNQTLKTAHGRTSIADDPIAYIENMAESGILLNNKNWVKHHLMLLAQNHPTSLLTLSKAWYVKSTDANGNEEWIPATPQITSQMNSNQVKAAIDAFEQKMEQLAQTGDATQQRDGLNIAYPQTHSEEREHEVRVMKDGEEYVIYVNGDPQLAQAMNNTRAHRVREIQSGKLDRAAAWLGRKMAAAYTSLSPLFIPSNYFRDLTMTLASTAIREDGRYNYLLRKNLATSWNLGFMLKDYQNGKLRDKVNNGNATPKEQMFYDFMMNGGETGFVSSLDVEDLKKKFKNDLKDLDRWKANPVKVGHTIMDGIEFLNRAIEDSNRFAVYMTSIQYGRSIDEAVNDAKDVTLNFNRKGTGEYGWQMIRNLYLFINPAVQSLQTLGALAKHHPFKFTAVTAAWLASGVLVPIVNAALMSLLGGDDDKDKYWQFSKWDRRNNAIMWIPFTNEYVKIPLAQEFRAFYGIGDMIASKMMGGELAEETWSQYAEDLLGQVVDMLPLDPTGYDGNIAVSLMPNPIRPVFELAFNVDFTGKPLFKETEYNKYDPNFTKAYVGTPDWLVRASRMMNSIGNDYPDVQQNRWDALGNPRYNINNPAVVDHVLSSYLGGAYTMGSQVLGVLTKSLNDPKEIKMADIPLVSKFVSNPDDRPVTKKQGDEFWNMKENHDRAANTLSKLKKQAKVDGDYSMLERFYGSEEYKQYKQEDVKVKKYEEDKKKERAEESGEEYRPHKLNAEDIYKAHATPKDDFEDLKLKQLYTKLNGFKTSYDLLLDTAPSQSDGYYNTNKAAIDAIDEISLDKQEISELKKGFLEDGKDAYNAEDMKRIRELRKRILSVLEPANKVVVANQKAKAEK